MLARLRLGARLLVPPLLVLSLQGCEYLKAATFEKAPASGSRAHTAVVVSYLPYESTFQGLLADNGPLAAFDPALLNRFDECRRAKIPHALAPLIGLAFGWAVGYIEDSLASVVTRLRDQSQRTYGAHAIVDLKGPGAPFYGNECIVVLRGAIAEKEGRRTLTSIGMAALFRVKPHGDHGMVLVPAYLRMKDAVAVTADAPTPVVNLAMAVSIASAGVVDGVPAVIQTAADTLNFGAVPVSAAGPAAVDCDPAAISSNPRACPAATRLLARPPERASAIMVSVGVTESGTGVANADKALAELKALRQALGPVLEKKVLEAITGR